MNNVNGRPPQGGQQTDWHAPRPLPTRAEMTHLKISIDARVKRDLQLIAVQQGDTVSQLCGEILASWLRMSPEKLPSIPIAPRMADLAADAAIARAMQADEGQLGMQGGPTPRTPPRTPRG